MVSVYKSNMDVESSNFLKPFGFDMGIMNDQHADVLPIKSADLYPPCGHHDLCIPKVGWFHMLIILQLYVPLWAIDFEVFINLPDFTPFPLHH